MMEIPTTVPEVVAVCAANHGMVPVNVEIGLATEAHRQWPCANSLYAVILARMPTVADTQRQLDYLTGLPDKAWEDVPHWEEHREATLPVFDSGGHRGLASRRQSHEIRPRKVGPWSMASPAP